MAERGWLRRRRALLGLLVLVPLVACSNDDEAPVAAEGPAGDQVVAELPDLAQQFVGAVFRVETEGCGWIGSGSGFAIDAHHVVTNHHVVANDSSPIVRDQAGRAMEGRVIGSTERPDLAVIELDETLPTTVAWADTQALQRLEPLVVMGFPIPDRTFKVSTGTLIGFQPPESREALVANNPIDRGNSGGPALRRDGTVAGVVTEMASRDDNGGRVAIVFTASAVRRTVEAMIDQPKDVLSSCGLGPDYVPTVPTDFVVPPAEDIPAPPVQPDTAELVTPSTGFPTVPTTVPPTAPTTTTSLVCPSPASVGLDIEDLAAVEGTAPDTFLATVRGAVRNTSGEAIQVTSLEVIAQADGGGSANGFAVIDPPTVGAGQVRAWTRELEVGSPSAPSLAQARLRWSWTSTRFQRCPAPAIEATYERPVVTP